MKVISFLIFFQTILLGQLLPTIPGNVFRLSLGTSTADSRWKMNNNQFSLKGIGRRYFDNDTHNDSVRFSSNHDLYHNGSTYIDSVTTIQDWMTNFNLAHGFSLPIFRGVLRPTQGALAQPGLQESRHPPRYRQPWLCISPQDMH